MIQVSVEQFTNWLEAEFSNTDIGFSTAENAYTFNNGVSLIPEITDNLISSLVLHQDGGRDLRIQVQSLMDFPVILKPYIVSLAGG